MYKVGQKVRITGNSNPHHDFKIGSIGTIVSELSGGIFDVQGERYSQCVNQNDISSSDIFPFWGGEDWVRGGDYKMARFIVGDELEVANRFNFNAGCGYLDGHFGRGDVDYIVVDAVETDNMITNWRAYKNGSSEVVIRDCCPLTDVKGSLRPRKSAKGIMKKLSIIAKKTLDKDIALFVELGWLDGELEISEAGRKAIDRHYFIANKAELAKDAAAEKAEIEKSEKNK